MQKKNNINTLKLAMGTMFFVSGFCGLLYQTIWLRLAFAQFGVIAPVVSIVVSIFMLGLGIGSWVGGIVAVAWKRRMKRSVIWAYGLVEIFIGFGAFLVPALFSWGGQYIGDLIAGTDNWLYLTASAVIISFAILPWSIAMGMTYPFAVEFIRDFKKANTKSFGFLYAANTAGACLGAVTTVFVLIEILGFKNTLLLAAICNLVIGAAALIWGSSIQPKVQPTNEAMEQESIVSSEGQNNRIIGLTTLFVTGFCSMAMEVEWIRSFAVQLGSVVYSFSTVLAIYLLSNWFGAFIYRFDLGRNRVKSRSSLVSMAAIFSTIPLIVSCPKIWSDCFSSETLRLLGSGDGSNFSCLLPISVVLFSIVLGYLTPLIVDDLSCGDAGKAGSAYAVNILGCILGPLVAGYLLLPILGVRFSLILTILPLVILIFATNNKQSKLRVQIARAGACLIILAGTCFFKSFEEGAFLPDDSQKIAVLHRDYSATTIATKTQGRMSLLVNGIGMTGIDAMLKLMVHIPMAFHQSKPKSIAVICFGMGTTFRSALTWGAKVKAIELLPSVIQSFPYFYGDAASILKNPDGQIVIDDGRRFLRRTSEKFDVITLDPPPPLEAAASSLLYSVEFYKLVKQHLNAGGILQQWYGFPEGEKIIQQAAVRSIVAVFPYVRMYPAYFSGNKTLGGWYILASDSPFRELSAQEVLSVLPQRSKMDLYEWAGFDPETKITALLEHVLSNPENLKAILSPETKAMITDDHPLNEYYWLRRLPHQLRLEIFSH